MEHQPVVGEEHYPARDMEESAEGKIITINENISEDFKPDCYNLVGKIITNKEMNFKALKTALLGIWGNTRGVSILEAGRNGIIISFKERSRGIQTLKISPWFVKGYLLNLQLWSQHEALSEVDLSQMEMWERMQHKHGNVSPGPKQTEVQPRIRWRKENSVEEDDHEEARENQSCMREVSWKGRERAVEQAMIGAEVAKESARNEKITNRESGCEALITYPKERIRSEQVEESTNPPPNQGRKSGFQLDLIEEAIGKTIWKFIKGKYVDMEIDYRSGPLKQGDECYGANTKAAIRPNGIQQDNMDGEGQ
ncbi:hypothetical protein PIB30_078421, partial [Stylosanthes scabra]|nr:hypothetical protein [Stylosanthes scabra]